MPPFRPRTQLATHAVFNQPAALEDVNLFGADRLLTRLVHAAGGGAHADHLAALGARAGSAEVIELGVQANRNPPVFRPFDRTGQRIDEVEFHPAYHALMAIGLDAGVAARAWTHPAGGHVAHAALLFLMTQAEAGVCCPMSMTHAAIPALHAAPDLAATWVPRVLATGYDSRVLPPAQKRAVTIGMAMTEKQGGSDVRANTTRATAVADGGHELVGHKWFCSAPMSDAFLTLAQEADGLSCFLVPRWRPDNERNAIDIQRLKDKLGDRANASAEIEYHAAWAQRVGPPGRGVRTIVEMVNHTRLDCIVSAAGLMRQSLSLALHHAAGRTAFQRRLIDQPLMTEVLADVAIEVESHMALAFRIAQAFDRAAAGDASEATLARVLTPVAKYWVTKRCPTVIAETMEAHGGAGYIEESLLPRLFRAAPLNAIWEGSGNVIALDVRRALDRDAELAPLLASELAPLRDLGPLAATALDALHDALLTRADERQARGLAERLAVLAAARALQGWGHAGTAAALLSMRLGGMNTFGAGRIGLDAARIVADAQLV